jgi:MoxR-like ATPase
MSTGPLAEGKAADPTPEERTVPVPDETHAQPTHAPGAMPAAECAALLEDALFQIKRVVVGQDRMVERVLLSLLANGHCLIEGFPGLAKTLTVSTLSQVVGGQFARIQFTPDLVPADLVGTRIWRPSSEDFDIEWGPVFANIVLADEINRAPAKVQSALLEAMAERQVTVGGHTPSQVLTVGQLAELQDVVRAVFVHHAVQDYAVRLVMATRDPARWGLEDLTRFIALGASPRGTLGLLAAARALAVLRGRRFVVPQDVFDVAPEVLRHRVTLTYEALAEGLHADDVVRRVLSHVPAPRVAPQQDEMTMTLPVGFAPAPVQVAG